MKTRLFCAQRESENLAISQKRRYERVQTEYNSPSLIARKGSSSTVKNMEDFFKKTKLQFKNIPKQPQEIFEQNMNLKSFINNLQEQLTFQRSRLQLSKKNNLQYTKQLSREFSKEMYYSGSNPNGYMISGIKHQYAHMKSLYEGKCKEFQQLCESLKSTEIQELRTYIDALEEQNKFLKNTLKSIVNIKEEYKNKQQKAQGSSRNLKSFQPKGKHSPSYQQDNSHAANKNVEALALVLAQQKQNLRICLEKINYQAAKIAKHEERESQLSNKVQFLQKLLIEKDNNQTKARRAYKKIQKQKLTVQKEINKLNQQLKDLQYQHKRDLNKIQLHQQKKLQVQKQIFHQVLNEKTVQLANYEKEIRYLKTMLSYWKPLDQISKDGRKESLKDSLSLGQKESKSIEKEERLSNFRSVRTNSLQNYEPQRLEGGTVKVNKQNVKSENEVEAFMRRANSDQTCTEIQNQPTIMQQQIVKERRDCSKKYSDKAKRVRKVDLSQISKIGEHVRFKLIGHQINIQTAKSLFSGSNVRRSMPSQSMQPFIAMKQAKATLMEFPFILGENQATLFSRYIVEDANSEYVYWDEQNEIDRNIAKSILKAVIGEYSLPHKQEIVGEWSRVKQSFMGNIMTALKQVAPQGKISLYKFNQLITGLGVEMSEELKDWIVGELVIKSHSLEELQYAVIAQL